MRDEFEDFQDKGGEGEDVARGVVATIGVAVLAENDVLVAMHDLNSPMIAIAGQQSLRRGGAQDTPFAKATCGTIRLKLLKIGALVRVSVRRIKVAMASACPAADAWGCAAKRLAAGRQRAGVARLTRAAATRNPRGITPRPTETTSWPPLRLKKLLLLLASPDATMSRACIRANK